MKLRTFRHIIRLKHIITTLIKYGFGGLVTELRVLPWFSFFSRIFISKKAGRGLTVPKRIRLVLEELGPTFIKLGQVASTRADILPPDWLEEFKKLQDDVPSFEYEEARKVVERSLGASILEKFKTFEKIPVASASIAQVHFATLYDDTEVAVKVRRPDIEKTIDSDMAVMFTIAKLLHKHVPSIRRYRPLEVVDEFSRVIHNELNLTIEGSNAAIFGRLFKDDPDVKIPEVYWDYSSSEVLTLERIYGTPLDEAETIKAKGLDIRRISKNGVNAFFKQVFQFGVFHADLHPGNIFTTDEGVIVYLDFGIVGRLDKKLRRYLAGMLFCLIRKDYHRMAVIHREMGLIGKEVDLDEFENALRDITEPIFGKNLGEINLSTLLLKLIETARRFKMKLQPNLLLLQKSMVIIEGVGRQLYPDINMWEVAKPLIYKWAIKEKLSPGPHIGRGREFAEELSSTIFDLPRQTHALLTAALNDELKIGFVHQGLEPLSTEINATGKRIMGGFAFAALVVGSCILTVFSGDDMPRLWGMPLPGTIGFIISGITGLRLLMDSGKDKKYKDKDREIKL